MSQHQLTSQVRAAKEKELPAHEIIEARKIRSNALKIAEQKDGNKALSHIILQRICDEIIATDILINAALGGIGSDEERNITGEETSARDIADRADERLSNNNYLMSVLQSAFESGDIRVTPETMLVNIVDDVRDRGYRIAADIRKSTL